MSSGMSIDPALPIPLAAVLNDGLLHPDCASFVDGLKSVVGDVSDDAMVEGSTCWMTSLSVFATEFHPCSVSSWDSAIIEMSLRRVEIVSLVPDLLDISAALVLIVFCNVFVKCCLL